ncbi:MAG: rod shape determining protein RodA [Actinomycetota bacterium]|jgi:rod shape determining protein RodA|nr:rod shape determining protein RodA [Actinomycetota bacterium]
MATAAVPRRQAIATRRDSAAPFRHLDLSLIAAVLSIAALGALMVYSATEHRLAAEHVAKTYYLKRQVMFIGIGAALMALTALVDYRNWRGLGLMILGVVVLPLLLVLSPVGSSTRGSQAWFQLGSFQLQPSEFAKVGLIVFVASYCAVFRGELDARRLATVLGLAAIPMALIYKQPDLGTALVFVAILMGMLLVAGARPRHMAALTLVGILGVVGVVHLGVLKAYQRDRLTAFLDPKNDSQRAAYNLNQSKVAIANGGITGKGLFKGTQTNLSYVPEQNTDFIFTVVGEELGLVGSAALLMLFAIVVWRTWRSAALAKDLFGTLICVGVLSMLVFQIFENVGMTMGIMPITGIPLPFVSYGGSSTLASFLAMGLVLNVHSRRFA